MAPTPRACLPRAPLRAGGSRRFVRVLVVAAAAGWGVLQAPLGHAQPAIPSGLAPGGVAVVDGHLFARARAPMRDAQAPLQSLLATRASFYAARYLCQYTPTPDTRLEAPLARVSVVEARTEGDQLTVTIRLPMQRPDCVVRSLPPAQPALDAAEAGAPPPSVAPAATQSAYPTLGPPPTQPPRMSEIN